MFFREELVDDTKWLDTAFRMSWAAVCFGKPFLKERDGDRGGFRWLLSGSGAAAAGGDVEVMGENMTDEMGLDGFYWLVPRIQSFSSSYWLLSLGHIWLCLKHLHPNNAVTFQIYCYGLYRLCSLFMQVQVWEHMQLIGCQEALDQQEITTPTRWWWGAPYLQWASVRKRSADLLLLSLALRSWTWLWLVSLMNGFFCWAVSSLDWTDWFGYFHFSYLIVEAAL